MTSFPPQTPQPEPGDQWGAPPIPPAPQGGTGEQRPPAPQGGINEQGPSHPQSGVATPPPPAPQGDYRYGPPTHGPVLGGAHPNPSGYMYPAGAVPPIPQPPKKRRGWIIGLVIGFIVVLLCCGCLGALGVFGWKTLQETEKKAKSTVSDYLDTIERSDYAEAYDYLCEDLQNDETQQEFTQRMTAESNVRKLTDYSVDNTSSDSNGDIRVKAKLTYTDTSTGAAETEKEEYTLSLDDDGDFRICS